MEPIGHITDSQYFFNYDLSQAPRFKKCQILTSGGIAMMGQVTGDPKKDRDIWAWAPMPKRNRSKEKELGLTTLPPGYAAGPIKEETNAAYSVTNEDEKPQTCSPNGSGLCSHVCTRDLLPQRSNQLSEVQQPSTSPSPSPCTSSCTNPTTCGSNAELECRCARCFNCDSNSHSKSTAEPEAASGADE
jgi:hypothetical protein